MLPSKKSPLLTAEQIEQKISRMAYEILENNYDEQEVIMAGIKQQGYYLAEKIAARLKKITKIKIQLISIEMDKQNPLEPVLYGLSTEKISGKVIIIVDDVANTGKTLTYALKPVLDIMPKKLQVAVLIDRKHKLFPISPDYCGLMLSTTMKDHIRVEIGPGENQLAYLG